MADISSVTNVVAGQVASGQTSAALVALKQSIDAESDIALALADPSGAASQANLPSGVGQTIDTSA